MIAWMPSWFGTCLIGIPSVIVLALVALVIRHYLSDRPFPAGCCKRCGFRFPGPEVSQCRVCGRVRHCQNCGYNLTGGVVDRCPECGQVT